MEDNILDCVIVGSGPAGFTAAIYAARADLKPVLYTGLEPGGQLTTTTEVDNFPGYPNGVTGPEMMMDLQKQAERFETKYLGLDDEKKFMGGGVSACATCDGFFYKGKDVIVVGAGDTAAEEATYLAKLVNKVTILVRKDYMRASKAMIHRVNNTANIEVKFNHELTGIEGENNLVERGVVINNETQETSKIDVHGIFIAIGHKPNTEIFAGQINLDENGYINTIPGSSKTNLPGVFAVGDVQDSHYRQAITAAGSGCMGAMDSEKYLGELE